jgi:biopolymer transport protein ExbD
MPRGKIKKKSTHVDMTAMCDVAFLLLTFFILVGKFKPSEAVAVTPPSSVSNKIAPDKDFFMVTIDRDNKAYISMDDNMKADVLGEVGKLRGMSFTDGDVTAFRHTDFVGVPLNQIKQYDNLPSEQQSKVTLPGVPYDSANNELLTWVTAAVKVSEGKKVKFLIKGDGQVKYPNFEQVIKAFKKNDIYKYNLVTNQTQVPQGSELWKKNMARGTDAGDNAGE